MKRNKKIIISLFVIIIIVIGGIFAYYQFFYNENELSLKEKEWLDTNKDSIITINVGSNINTFSNNGNGIFIDFIEELSKKHSIKINKNIVEPSTNNGLGLTISNSKIDNGLLMYEDHYVIIGKNDNNLNDYKDLTGSKIGGLNDYITSFSNIYNITATYTTFETKELMLEGIKNDNVDYLIVPLNEYIDVILENNYNISLHLSDIKKYYYIHLGSEEILNNIVEKFFNEWKKSDYENVYYDNLYNLFVDKLGLNQVETDILTNKKYNLGFTTITPFTSVSRGKFGGIIFSYLEDFSKFANVEFNYIKYKNNNSLANAYEEKDIELLYTDSTTIKNNFSLKMNLNYDYNIVGQLNEDINVNNIKLIEKKVYVIKDSYIANNIKDKVKIEEVKNEQKLLKEFKKGNLIALDSRAYEYYQNTKLNNSLVVYHEHTKNPYELRYNSNTDAFYKLLSSYIKYIDNNIMVNKGTLAFDKTFTSDSIFATIAKYFLVILSIGIITAGFIISSKKHIKLDTRIKKDEKLKFIDMLTSLKNRNYLNEKINIWNKNTIYPQGIIVIDLNNVKYLNDTFGHEEGDKQIKAAANILIKTQLDNTEIMRTDGNEFMVYLVGYNEKQVINYIKKLLKEFKDLPYEYGAAFGFSMIVDDLKLIDDAINEASIQMRENKENFLEANNEAKENI